MYVMNNFNISVRTVWIFSVAIVWPFFLFNLHADVSRLFRLHSEKKKYARRQVFFKIIFVFALILSEQ